MKLVPLPPEYLRQDEPLPFGVRDATGLLLLAAGQRIAHPERLVEMAGQSLFSDEAESAPWYRRLAAAMDLQLRQGAQLRTVAAARPEPVVRAPLAAVVAPLSLREQWREIEAQLYSVLRDVRAGSDWRARLLVLHARAREVAQRRADGSLYHLIYEAGHTTERYSAHHALLALLICEETAALLGWAQPWIDSLGRAALTMNVAMLRLQDLLAGSLRPPSPEMLAEIQVHPEQGARQLEQAGLGDALALAVVRLHHDAGAAGLPLAQLAPECQLARLLRRVDIFAASISLRASRPPMSPVLAAREACLGASGQPDEIGSALLRAVGLYPPGSFVELAGGEIGIVIARGRRVNLPQVATLVSASGNVLGEPALRDTVDSRYAVRSALPPAGVKVRPPHERLLAMR